MWVEFIEYMRGKRTIQYETRTIVSNNIAKLLKPCVAFHYMIVALFQQGQKMGEDIVVCYEIVRFYFYLTRIMIRMIAG